MLSLEFWHSLIPKCWSCILCTRTLTLVVKRAVRRQLRRPQVVVARMFFSLFIIFFFTRQFLTNDFLADFLSFLMEN